MSNNLDIKYSLATAADAQQIASLHADSWQRHYHHIYSREYLENEVLNERIKVWSGRFRTSNPSQYVILARDQAKLIGFACTYLDHDPVHGALLDNLHVLKEYQGYGIGKSLMEQSHEWVKVQRPGQPFYLYVLAQNHAAIKFYRRQHATLSDKLEIKGPTGTVDEVYRCKWD